jgi:3-hydroxyisobutyrate dehydrogenase-like beta-hydroxyacid dehydrogenase
VAVLNRSPLPDHLKATVVVWAAEVARAYDVVITMLPDTPDVERVLLGERGTAGCDPATVRTALTGGFAFFHVLEVHGERMIKRSFAPGFRVRFHQKDLSLAFKSAGAFGVSLTNAATAHEMMNACSAREEWRRGDHSSLVWALEILGGQQPMGGKE